MNRVHLAILRVLLITVGLGMAPARSIHLPLVMQGVYWAVPSDPPEALSNVQVVEPQVVSQGYADEYQLLLERFEAARQDYRVIFGSDVHGLRIIQDTDGSDNLDDTASESLPPSFRIVQ